jgi:histidine ammonia-lyase
VQRDSFLAQVIIDGSSLKIEDLVGVSRNGRPVELSKQSVEGIERSRFVLERLAREGKTIYGVTTGFGALSNTRITVDQASELQRNLLRSHAAGVGDMLPTDVVRAIMLLRLNTLAKGLSGVRVEVVKLIENFLNQSIHPQIPSKGSVGASGDLAPLSHMALALLGEGMVDFKGRLISASEALKQAGLKPLTVSMKEGLALNNGTQMSTAIAALVVHDAQHLLKIAEVAAATSLDALRGFTQAFDARIHQARPFKGQIESAQNLRMLIEGSQLVKESVSGEHESAQDAYSLRCTPQVMGAVREAVEFAERLVEVEMNSATDNPLIFADSSDVLSGGNFHGQTVGMAMDVVSIGLATVANLSERRTYRMLDSHLSNGLPPFLVGTNESNGLQSGLMAVQYTAAALASENKVLAHPATVDTIHTSAGMEDFVSMSPAAGLKARAILENARRVIAIELICAAQGLDFRDPSKCGKGAKAAYEKIREKVSMVREDRALASDIQEVYRMVSSGSLLEAVETSVGLLK